MTLPDLSGRVAIVTGGGHGAGAAVAIALAAAGAKVCISDLNPDRAMRVEREITSAGGEAISVPADIANKFQCVTVIETTRKTWGQLDIIVNAMAVGPTSSIIKLDEWDFQRAFEVNLKGSFFMTQLSGRVMADENKERGGSIVQLASTAGITEPLINQAAACAMNGAVIAFSKECAREYADHNLRVNTVLTSAQQPNSEKTAEHVLRLFSTEFGQMNGIVIEPSGRLLDWKPS
ncbi:MAG: SDR family NAD(P)-dependent oxidoreductase [Anaerolineae bacterium]